MEQIECAARHGARAALGEKFDLITCCQWPRFNNHQDNIDARWKETKYNLLRWAVAHPRVESPGLVDLNAFILVPRKDGTFLINPSEPEAEGFAYQSWAPRFLSRVYKPAGNDNWTSTSPDFPGSSLGYAVLYFSPELCAGPDGFVHSGALGTAIDNILGAITMEWSDGPPVVTKTISTRSMVTKVPVGQMLLVTIEMSQRAESKGRTVVATGRVFDASGGSALYWSEAQFAKLPRPLAEAEKIASNDAEEAWIVSVPAPVFRVATWERPPVAFTQNCERFATRAGFQELMNEPCVDPDGPGWDFFRGKRITMRSFYSPQERAAVGVVFFGRATLGPPPALVNGGATLAAIDELMRRLAVTQLGLGSGSPGGSLSDFCCETEVQYQKGVPAETTALITVRVVLNQDGQQLYLAGEIVSCKKRAALDSSWEDIPRHTSLTTAAAFTRSPTTSCL